MNEMKKTHPYLMSMLLLFISASAWAQSVPGDLYKEYAWFNEAGDCNGALRVGGWSKALLLTHVRYYCKTRLQ